MSVERGVIPFERTLALGKQGEKEIGAWLRSRGCGVLHIYPEGEEFKGPRLLIPEGALIAPDMQVFTRQRTLWVEAKHKTFFSWYRKGGYWTTGIDLKHYTDYQIVSDVTARPVWLLFLHKESLAPDGTCPTGLFGGDIRELARRESHRSTRWGRSGMVYWRYEHLARLATLDEVYRAAQAAQEHTHGHTA